MATPQKLDEETIDGLRDLIRINVDSKNGLLHAAEKVEDANLTRLFQQIAEEREEHVTTLRSHVRMSDEEAEDSGSVQAKMHRWWISLRAGLSGDEAKAVLNEAERGEDTIKERYEEILPKLAGNPLNDVLLGQYQEVKRHHDLIRDCRDQLQ